MSSAKRLLLAVLLILTSAEPIFAATDSPENLVYCRQSELIGLYEQCEEVIIRESLGERMRVYSVPAHKVLLIPKSNLFRTQTFKTFEKAKPNQLVGISSSDLWNSSSAGYQSLCRVINESKSGMLSISCGRFQDEKILKSRALMLTPYSARNNS